MKGQSRLLFQKQDVIYHQYLGGSFTLGIGFYGVNTDPECNYKIMVYI